MRLHLPTQPHTSERAVRSAWTVVMLLLALLLVWLAVTAVRQSDRIRDNDTRLDRADVALLQVAEANAAQDAALEEANRRLVELGATPVPPPPSPTVPPSSGPGEVQEREIQEPEIQEPEAQDPERQDREAQEGDVDDPEVQDTEVDDPDPDDPEAQDPEVQDPEDQEPEEQDPEVDDPDPNDLLRFEVADSCSPPEGSYVTGVDLVWDGPSVTLTLTCTSAQLPDFPGPKQ